MGDSGPTGIRPEKSAAFYDRAAADYDRQLGSAGDRWVRGAFWEFVTTRLRPRSTILDFGCGTGSDAAHYVSEGHRVLAYDNSPRMIDELRRAHPREVERGDIDAWSVPYAHVRSSLEGRGPVHAVTANFAVVNHLPDLGAWFRTLAAVTEPGAVVLVSSLNACYLPALRQPGFWKGVLSHGRDAGVLVPGSDHDHVRSWPWSAGRDAPGFRVASRAGVGALIFGERAGGDPGDRGDWRDPRSRRERVERALWQRTPGWALGRFTFLELRKLRVPSPA